MEEQIDTASDVIQLVFEALEEAMEEDEESSPVMVAEALWDDCGSAITQDLLKVCNGQLEETKNIIKHDARCCVGLLQMLAHLKKVTEHVSEGIPSLSD